MQMWRMRIACCIHNAKTHIQNMLQLLLFHSNNGCTNAPQLYLACYVHCLSFINYIVQVQYLYKILPAASITLHIKALNINITEL